MKIKNTHGTPPAIMDKKLIIQRRSLAYSFICTYIVLLCNINMLLTCARASAESKRKALAWGQKLRDGAERGGGL